MARGGFPGLVLAGAIAIAGQTALAADPIFSTKSSRSVFASQSRVLDTRASSQYTYSTRLQPNSILSNGDSSTPRPYTGKYRGKFYDLAKSAARKHGIPEAIFLNLVQQESNWNANAVSHKGAIGLAQLMPGTAKVLRVNPRDPKQNLEGGARYLSQQYRKFGNWKLALAAYNAGPQAVQKHKGIPPYKETKNYVRKIWGS